MTPLAGWVILAISIAIGLPLGHLLERAIESYAAYLNRRN